MSKSAKAAGRLKTDEMAPKFLLFLKARGWGRSAEDPAKSSPVIEGIVFVAFCFAILAIVAIAYERLRHN